MSGTNYMNPFQVKVYTDPRRNLHKIQTVDRGKAVVIWKERRKHEVYFQDLVVAAA